MLASASIDASADLTTSTLVQTLVLTAAAAAVYSTVKSAFDRVRLASSRATVVVVGGGPVGLVAALVAARTGRASRVIVFEERDRTMLVTRSDPVTIGPRAMRFLRSPGVGIDLHRTIQTSSTHPHHPHSQQSLVVKAGDLLRCLLDAIENDDGGCSGGGDGAADKAGEKGTRGISNGRRIDDSRTTIAADDVTSGDCWSTSAIVELRLGIKV